MQERGLFIGIQQQLHYLQDSAEGSFSQ